MRQFILLSCFLCISVSSSAQDIRFDTLATRPVGPGVIHTYIEAPALPWTINVLEIDLTNPFIEIETAKAHDLLAGGYEETSSMAARRDAPGHRVVGAVNGDFYGGAGRPINTQVLGGEILQPEASGRTALGFDIDYRPMMEIAELEASLFLSDTALVVHDVNGTRDTDELVLYNRYRGATTGTNEFGTELRVRPLDPWLANDTLRLVIEEKGVGAGSMAIPDGDAVLSGHGAAAAVLTERVEVGDTVRAYLGLHPGLENLAELVGGGPFLVQNGVSSVGPRGDAEDRHPRTAAGFSADSTRLYLITVDGRQTTSVGITLPELAYFMTRLGIQTGMNLDGGGSTTMVVRDEIVNSPSGGSERAISNSLLVISTAPEGELSRLFAFPDQVRVFMGESTSFTAYGADDYFGPVQLDTSLIEFSADAAIGAIDDEGVFTAGTDSAEGYVYVEYGNLADSAHVFVKTIGSFELTPTDVLTDTSHVVTFSARAFDVDGLEQDVSPTVFTWSSTNPEVGVVNESGEFRGLSSGTTEVVAEHRHLRQTATVTVDIQSGVNVVSSMEDLGSWTLDGQAMDMSQTNLSLTTEEHVEGEGALRIDYSFTYDRALSNEIYLETGLPLAGVPDSLIVDVKSDGARHRVYFDVEDAQGSPFELFAAAYADDTTQFKPQPAAFDRAQPQSPTALTLYYPVTLKRIILRLASDRVHGETYSGTLFLDHLRVSYPAEGTAVETGPELPAAARLLANFPNPFSRSTTIAYELDEARDVELTVYDVLGRRVRVLESGLKGPGRHEVMFEPGTLSSGVYFYRLQTPRNTISRKMLITR